ncbi:MAG: competence/damage-inducible protein A [Actinomycetota bacterium]
MRAEVVAVGTELLLGQIVNTNASFVSDRLGGIGVDVCYHTCVGDNPVRMAEVLRSALARVDVVVVTGGLGPTQDDITREALAEVAGVGLSRRPEAEAALRERFARLGREMAEMNLRQADLPAGSILIPATVGTAPGFIMEISGKVVYALPGVPREMEDMIERAVLADLSRRMPGPAQVLVSRVLKVVGLPESEIAQRVAGVWAGSTGNPTLAFLASVGEVKLRLTAKAASKEEARALIEPDERAMREILGSAVMGADEDTLESVVGALLRQRGQTLATAESLTAGLVAGRIASVPGASAYFAGGLVGYAVEAKASVLGVDPGLLATYGPVSEPTVVAMAEAVRRRFGVTWGIATTGVAGPETQGGQPVGTLWVGLDGPDGPVARRVRVPGEREQVRRWAVAGALNLLRLSLLDGMDAWPAAPAVPGD